MNRRIAIPAVALALLAVVVVFTRGFGLVDREDGGLVLYGNVDVRQVDLAFRVGGRIASIVPEEGMAVRAGQAIATLGAERRLRRSGSTRSV